MAGGGSRMNLDDAKRYWQAQPEPRDAAMSDTQILELVKRRSRAFDTQIRRRDRIEAITAVVVAVLFLPALLSAPWLARAGALVMLAAIAFILVKLNRARSIRTPEDSDRPLSELLNSERAKVDAQIRLLESVAWWYIVPPGIGAIMVVVGLVGISWFTLVYAVFVVAISVWIYRLNQRAARHDLRPRREELVRLLEQLKE